MAYTAMGALGCGGACAQQRTKHAECSAAPRLPNRISLAQWSLHRMLKAGSLAPMDFPQFSRTTFGICGVEYVSTFYRHMVDDARWSRELRARSESAGVESLLIMCDGEGELGDSDPLARRRAVDAHRRWLDVAAALGCHSIRVNARGAGSEDEQRSCCADGLAQLSAIALPMKLNVIVENHGGISCSGAWVAGLVRAVGAPNCGTLPDFGNFRCDDGSMGDRYEGVAAMMPYARAVSAKSYEFDAAGFETATDYPRMMAIVTGARYRGWIGAEYEGKVLDEIAGTNATRDLLIRCGCVV